MKKILHVLPSLGIGGTEKILLKLCQSLGAPNFQHQVVALKSGGVTADALRHANVEVTILHSADGFVRGFLDLPRLWCELRSIIKKEQPNIVHTWLSRANVVGRLSSCGLNVPVVSSLRVIETQKKYHLWMERWTQRFCKFVTVNSSSLKQFAIQRIGISSEKIIFIPNGIDAPPVYDAKMAQAFRARWAGSAQFVIGTIGRLHSQKGIDTFVGAAQMVLKEIPNCHFLIIGDGPEQSALQDLIELLGLEKKVLLCGWAKNPMEVMAALDIFALCSRWEGMPNTILEAMALRKPIVSSAFNGIDDLISADEQGLVFPIGNVQLCAAAMLKILKNSELAQRLGENAYEKVTRQFSQAKMIRSYEKLYESC